jgi:hypothetical protein
MLKDQGLIDELDLIRIEGEKRYYEVKTNHDHCHMACFRCGGHRGIHELRFREAEGRYGGAKRVSGPRGATGSGRILQEMPEGCELDGGSLGDLVATQLHQAGHNK